MNYKSFSFVFVPAIYRVVVQVLLDYDSSLLVVFLLPNERNSYNTYIPHVPFFVLHVDASLWQKLLCHRMIQLQKIKNKNEISILYRCFQQLLFFFCSYSPTHKLLLNSTLWSLTAFSWASNSVSNIETAPFFATNRSWRIASSIVIPRIKQAMYHIFSGLYLILAFWWQMN